MTQNSSKPADTGLEHISAIKELRSWLDQKGGNHRIPQVLELLASQTARAWATGQPSPAIDAETLRKLYCDAHGGLAPDGPASRWLKRTEVEQWWNARLPSLEQALRTSGIGTIPVLKVVSGGGRANPTQYRFDRLPLDEQQDGQELANDLTDSGLVRYRSERAVPSWWLRPIVGTAPFRMRSLRGYFLIGLLLIEALALLLCWGLALVILRPARPITTADVSLLLVLAAGSWTWWHAMRPLIRLPIERITVATDLLLGWTQLHGQFRLVRDTQSKRLGGWFQLERHHAVCSVCSGEVELEDGRQAFPGRVVGRCSDSPTEHVFSFDPVTLTGQRLVP